MIVIFYLNIFVKNINFKITNKKNGDDLGLESFGFDREQNRMNSPSFLNSSNSSSTFKRYRTFSESQNNQNNNNTNQNGNMPSPSISSCQSYSNSSSPTGFILNNNNANSTNPGLLVIKLNVIINKLNFF